MKEIIEKTLKHNSSILVKFVFATSNLIIYLAMNIGEQRKIVYSTISLIYVMTIIGLTIFKCKNIYSIDDGFIHLNFFLNIIIIIFYFCSIILLIVINVKTGNFDFIQIMFIASVYIHLVTTLVLVINLSFKIFNIVSELMKEKDIKREEEEQQKKEIKMMKIDIDI